MGGFGSGSWKILHARTAGVVEGAYAIERQDAVLVDDDCVEVTYVHRRQLWRKRVPMVWRSSPFGMYWLFVCPGCGAARRSLYVVSWDDRPLCRLCHRLSYESKWDTPPRQARLLRRGRYLARLLRTSWPDPVRGRPRGMWRKRYVALCLEYDLVRRLCGERLNAWVSAGLARVGLSVRPAEGAADASAPPSPTEGTAGLAGP